MCDGDINCLANAKIKQQAQSVADMGVYLIYLQERVELAEEVIAASIEKHPELLLLDEYFIWDTLEKD
ncbi:MAG: hypothetical protein ACJARG_001810 [Arcticibacterium sp.]|jgi:hypothetical protein